MNKTRLIVYTTLFSLLPQCVSMGSQPLAEYTLRPQAAAVLEKEIKESFGSKASSSGTSSIHLTASASMPDYAVQAALAFQDPHNPNDIQVPIWHGELETEIALFNTVTSDITAYLENRIERVSVDDRDTAVGKEALRLLGKYAALVREQIQAAEASNAADVPILREDSVSMLRGLVSRGLEQYAENINTQTRDYTVSRDASELLQLLINGEDAVEVELMPLSAEPTQAELEQLQARATKEYERFRNISQRFIDSYMMRAETIGNEMAQQKKKLQALAQRNIERRKALTEQIDTIVEQALEKHRQQRSLALDDGQYISLRQQVNTLKEYLNLVVYREGGDIDREAAEKVSSHLLETWGAITEKLHDAINSRNKAAIAARLRHYVHTVVSMPGIETSIKDMHKAKSAAEVLGFTIDNMLSGNIKLAPSADAKERKQEEARGVRYIRQENAPAAHIISQIDDYVKVLEFAQRPITEETTDAAAYMINGMRDVAAAVKELLSRLRAREGAQQVFRRSNRPIAVVLDDKNNNSMDADSLAALATRYNIKFILSEVSSTTSHLALFARGLGIPLVKVDAEGPAAQSSHHIRRLVKPGETVAVQTHSGAHNTRVTIRPTKQESQQVVADELMSQARKRYHDQHSADPVSTKDGYHMRIVANTGLTEEAEQAALVTDGVGLLRSEFLLIQHIALLSEYAHELSEYNQGHPDMPHKTRLINRELLFYAIRQDLHEQFVNFFDRSGPFTIRSWDIKKDPKGRPILEAIFASPSEWRTGFDLYRQTSIGRDMLVLFMEAILDLRQVAMSRKAQAIPVPALPEITNNDELMWFFEEIVPEAIANQKERMSREILAPQPEQVQHIEQAAADKSFNIMAETLGIEQQMQSILENNPSLRTINIGTNDWFAYLLQEQLRIPVSREDSFFSSRFTELDPLLLSKIEELAAVVSTWNSAHPDDQKKICVCGDLASAEKFVLFALHLSKKYAVELSLSVPPDSISRIKNFIRFVNTETDLCEERRLSSKLLFEHIDYHIDAFASRRVAEIEADMAQDTASGYKYQVTDYMTDMLSRLGISPGEQTAQITPAPLSPQQAHKILREVQAGA